MIHRMLVAALAAVFLLIAPVTAANAAGDYSDDSGTVTTSDSNPEPGETFTVTVSSDSCPLVSLDVSAPSDATTIDGQRRNRAGGKAAVGGSASFAVAIDEEGEYTLTGRCETTDEVLGVEMVVVGDGDAGDDDQGGDTGDDQGEDTGDDQGDDEGGVVGDDQAESGGPGAVKQANVAGTLPDTGADSTTTVLAAGGVLLLVAGGALLVARRRQG